MKTKYIVVRFLSFSMNVIGRIGHAIWLGWIFLYTTEITPVVRDIKSSDESSDAMDEDNRVSRGMYAQSSRFYNMFHNRHD
jgi:CRISPR/Cas system type I-B associated protein Csh2 (Cas7 group RAMP superfamily)